MNRDYIRGDELTAGQKDDLERLMDRVGLRAVLIALAEICSDKADHVSVMWDDESMARAWRTAECAIGVAVPRALGL
jgi:hypothetical protein